MNDQQSAECDRMDTLQLVVTQRSVTIAKLPVEATAEVCFLLDPGQLCLFPTLAPPFACPARLFPDFTRSPTPGLHLACSDGLRGSSSMICLSILVFFGSNYVHQYSEAQMLRHLGVRIRDLILPPMPQVLPFCFLGKVTLLATTQ